MRDLYFLVHAIWFIILILAVLGAISLRRPWR
jgi:hypothetical protein